MESNALFNNIGNTIKLLEHKLIDCEGQLKQLEQRSIESMVEIESHFQKCREALDARQQQLISECAFNINNQRLHIEEVKQQVQDMIEGCTQTRRAGTMLYSASTTAAEKIWESVKGLSLPKVKKAGVFVRLSNSLQESIALHGSVSLEARFSVAHKITTLVGTDGGHCDGTKNSAKIANPSGLYHDTQEDCLYLCDNGTNRIRIITFQGIVSTFAKNIQYPRDIVKNHKTKEFYVTSVFNNAIVKISPSGEVQDFVGGYKGIMDAFRNKASFLGPCGITIDQTTGNLYITDVNIHLIRMITPEGDVSTIAGSVAGFADGAQAHAQFNQPAGILFDALEKCLLVCDQGNNLLRRISQSGVVSTLCTIPGPSRLAMSANRIILVTTKDKRIYKVVEGDTKYIVSVLVQSTVQERRDGDPNNCGLGDLSGIAIHEPSHSCFVSDQTHAIRKISFI